MSTALKQTHAAPPETVQTGKRLMGFVRYVSEHYFRSVTVVEDTALEHSRTPVIFAANHSGMNFPWDCFLLYEDLVRRYQERLTVRPLSAPILFDNPILSPFVLPTSWNYFSALATMPSFEKLMKEGTSVLINPEGIPGIAKGFNRKYQLQPFSSAFVRMCLKYDRPMVPISVVNGEYLNPMAYSFKWVDRAAQMVGIPFLPVGPTILLFAIFPCCAYISLPARLHFVIGRRIDLRQFVDKSYDELSVQEIRALTTKVQQMMQEHLNQSVERYGKAPFDFKSLFQSLRRQGLKGVTLFPLYWPVLVHRAYLGENYTWRKAALSSLICFALCLPVLGWPLLFLILAVTSPSRRRSKRE